MKIKITMNKILKQIDELIIEGINITRQAQEKDAIYSGDSDLSDNVHKRYFFWKEKIKSTLNQEKVTKEVDIGFFYEADSVPNIKSGPWYGNIESIESQELLKNIRVETSKKMDILRKIKSELSKSKEKESKKVVLQELPVNIKWEDLEIKFKNEYEVEIHTKGQFYKKVDHKELGFYKSKTKDDQPDICWHFLILLSAIQEIDKAQATTENMARSLGQKLDKKITKEACEKIKSRLSKKLREVSGINNKPFYPYKDYGFYQPKFRLRPFPVLRGKGEPFMTKSSYDNNIENPQTNYLQ